VNRAAGSARSNDRERRDVAFVSIQMPFQFPLARYQTELCGSLVFLPRSMPEGHGQGGL
jgi:hypothetical protein